MATNENNVKCEGCIHQGQFGNCWMGETPAECNNKMTIEQAIGRLDDNIYSAERAGRLYAEEMTIHTHTARRAAMFDGNDLREAFEAGAAWAAQFAQHPDK